MPFFGEKGWESFAVSMRGHGGSEPASSSASTMDEQIQDLASLMHTMQRAPILVAHSLGGIVAQRCAHHCPSDTRRLARHESRAARLGDGQRSVQCRALLYEVTSMFSGVRAGI